MIPVSLPPVNPPALVIPLDDATARLFRPIDPDAYSPTQADIEDFYAWIGERDTSPWSARRDLELQEDIDYLDMLAREAQDEMLVGADVTGFTLGGEEVGNTDRHDEPFDQANAPCPF